MPDPTLLDKVLPVIGMRDMVYAKITADTAEGTVYGAVKQLQGVQKLGFKPNSAQQQSYGDDGIFCVVNSAGDAEGEIEMNTIPPEMEADWFGRSLDANGAVVMSSADMPNDVAIGFRAKKQDGSDKLVWLYKCTPSSPESAFATQESGNVTIQNRKVPFKATRRLSDGNMKIAIDSNTATLAASVVTNWTKAVYEPAATKTVDA